jgi:H+/Cl- antiporter ClcA
MSEARTRRDALRTVALACLVGSLAGLASALFLALLDAATALRVAHPRLVLGLPLAGVALGFLLEKHGHAVRRGTALALETVRSGGDAIPLRVAPMVLVGTLVTHLFGGSAGREGTAVQMGAALADAVSTKLHIGPEARARLVVAGIAGGFGSVFGTPVAGFAFSLELFAWRRRDPMSVLTAALAALVGDLVARGVGIAHTAYPRVPFIAPTLRVVFGCLVLACATALVSELFLALVHGVRRFSDARLPRLPARMLVGGALVVALAFALGTRDYLGLGVPMIERAFHDPSVPPYAFLTKVVFTVLTVGVSFPGGEVTPLFFVGATLGNALATPLGLPLAAALGLSATFGASAKTPVALAIMAAELCSVNVLPYALLVCVLASTMRGRTGLYDG